MAFEEGFDEIVDKEPFLYPIPVRQPVIDLTRSPPPLAPPPRFTPAKPAHDDAPLNQQNPTRARTDTTQRSSQPFAPLPSGSGSTPRTTTGDTPGFAHYAPASFATNTALAQQFRHSQQNPPRRLVVGTNPAPIRFHSGPQQPYSNQQIPLITSAASARTPSAYLPTASSSLSSTPRPQPPPARPTLSNPKGKGREVVDLTTSDPEEEDDIIVLNDHPICIGQITTLALILHCVDELAPPLPSPTNDSAGRPLPPVATPPRNNQLPVHLYRAQRSGNNETIKIMSPGKKEIFGVMEHKTANVVASLLGDGYSGTGVTKGGNGKMWCSAAVLRRAERNVRYHSHQFEAELKLILALRQPLMLPLTLLIFTLAHNVEAVSSTLAASAIFLEHPTSYDPAKNHNAAYRNPHNPAAGASSRGSEKRRAQMANGLMGIGSSLTSDRAPKTVEVQREQVQSVFENLKSGMDLEETEPRTFICMHLDMMPLTVITLVDPMISTKLYPHQKQALSFLLDRETLSDIPKTSATDEQPVVSLWQRRVDPYNRPIGWVNLVTDLTISGAAPPPRARGSILADDMGCGKTVVVIALVAATLDEARVWEKDPPNNEAVDARFEEIVLDKSKKKVAEAASTSVYGVDPSVAAAMLSKFNPNQPLASTSAKPPSKKAQAKAKREKQRGDAHASRFARLVVRSRATLIVCPLSTVQNWESQIEEHVVKPDGGKEYRMTIDEVEDGKGKSKQKELSVYIYHGTNRTTDPIELANYDVVITTFSTLGTEFSKQTRAEDERDDAKAAAAAEEDRMEVYGADGKLVKTLQQIEEEYAAKSKKKRKRVEGTGDSPLQQVQWFRVVLDEAQYVVPFLAPNSADAWDCSIIKEHTTIQARAACDLSASRRTALSGTPLQNSLNDLFSLVRFLRLEPFTDRSIWTQHIGALAKNNDPLGVSRLQLIMRHLALRRTKQSKDKNGNPILDLPPNNVQLVSLEFGASEHAFYSAHHVRYKHEFENSIKSDSVMKNYCSILQELLRLRQICAHMALVRDAEDVTAGGSDVIKNIEENGISKPRAIQLLGLMKDAGGVFCTECGTEMMTTGDGAMEEATEATIDKKPTRKARKTAKSTTTSAACSEDEFATPTPSTGIRFIITRCQHLFCQACFKMKVCANWPKLVTQNDRADCSICGIVITPAIDAVEISADELERALSDSVEGESGKKGKKSRVFEHSTKTLLVVPSPPPSID